MKIMLMVKLLENKKLNNTISYIKYYTNKINILIQKIWKRINFSFFKF